jgi:DNA-directed RNA polymerase specialized sigma24 family protein
MSAFRQLDETELAKLDDGELVDYAIAAREAGRREEATVALRIFAFGMEDALRAFVRARLDSHGDVVIEEVAERALEDAIRSIETLRGRTAAEARGFVFKIARLRIADYHRRGRVEATPLDPDEGGAGEGAGLSTDGEAAAVDTRVLVEETMASLRPDHRAVVEQFVLRGDSARETAEDVASRFDAGPDDSMSEQNVHQIASRFRKELRARLEAAGEVNAR